MADLPRRRNSTWNRTNVAAWKNRRYYSVLIGYEAIVFGSGIGLADVGRKHGPIKSLRRRRTDHIGLPRTGIKKSRLRRYGFSRRRRKRRREIEAMNCNSPNRTWNSPAWTRRSTRISFANPDCRTTVFILRDVVFCRVTPKDFLFQNNTRTWKGGEWMYARLYIYNFFLKIREKPRRKDNRAKAKRTTSACKKQKKVIFFGYHKYIHKMHSKKK